MEFLGEIGGNCHLVVNSTNKFKNIDRFLAKELDLSSSNEKLSWDFEVKVLFPLPLYSKKIDLNFARLLPRLKR